MPASSRFLIYAIILLTALSFLYYFSNSVYFAREINSKAQLFNDIVGPRYKNILTLCGELCDLDKPIQPGSFMGTVKSKVNCDAIFESEEIDKPSDGLPLKWSEIHPLLQAEYNHSGLVQISEWFFDDHNDGGGRTEAFVFTTEMIQEYIDAFKNGQPKDNYGGASGMINMAAEAIGVENKTILVIGTQQPWLEAVLLTKSPAKIITLEYGKFKSEYPGLTFITPLVFREMYTDGTFPPIDLIFTYSSVEHSGLGRYGDALNPWGDILTIARAWCVTSPSAKLVIGVPTGGKDLIEFNAHRIYGPVLYPYLTTNWRFIWSSQGSYKPDPSIADGTYQPVYIFEKSNL